MLLNFLIIASSPAEKDEFETKVKRINVTKSR